MKTTVFNTTRDQVQKHLGLVVTFVSATVLVIALSLGFTQFASAQTFAPITAQADFGARGTNVTNIQAYLASNSTFYPEGLVTGYYGSLTRSAVQRFQAFYGIVSSGTAASTGYGRVGPSTMAKMNSLILGGVSTVDTSAPYLYTVNATTSTNMITMAFATSEAANARVHYDTTPIRFSEGDQNGDGFVVTSGQTADSDNVLRTNHSATISNLLPNTNYYYLVVVRDQSGNVNISTPGAILRTR